MRFCRFFISLLLVSLLPLGALAQEAQFRNGDDTFIAGDALLLDVDGERDIFVSAQSATLGGTALGDMHAAGFSVTINTDVAEDLYVAGATLNIRASVAGDTSAAGFTVSTAPSAETKGNARLMGNTITIEGPVEGALSVFGRAVILDAPVEGDVRIFAKSLEFGENAEVGGILRYSTEDRIDVPERVAPEDRVQYSKLEIGEGWEELREDWMRGDMPRFPTTASLFGAFLVTLFFFMVLGALALGFMPVLLENMRRGINAAPGRSILLGVIGLSMLFGLVPITAMTVIGLPFVPIVILVAIATWTAGYALGAYAVAMRLWTALSGETSPAPFIRLLLLATAITVIALLNFIPFVGWVANFTLVLIGVGAIARQIASRFITDPDPALDVDMNPNPD